MGENKAVEELIAILGDKGKAFEVYCWMRDNGYFNLNVYSSVTINNYGSEEERF